MLPLQLVVCARLPDVLGAKGKRYQARIAATVVSGFKHSATGKDALDSGSSHIDLLRRGPVCLVKFCE